MTYFDDLEINCELIDTETLMEQIVAVSRRLNKAEDSNRQLTVQLRQAEARIQELERIVTAAGVLGCN
jgi:chromosome condensin MukBEF ATPase and DNA-binding subunit MukB